MRLAKIHYRLILIFIMLAFAVSFSASPSANARLSGSAWAERTHAAGVATGAIANFPEMLRILDDEAFAGTSIEVAVFNDKLVHIGDRLFKDDHLLTEVFIPEATEYIGRSAFPSGILIHVVENSYAQHWAEDNGFQYVLDSPGYMSANPKGVFLEQVMSLFWFIIPDDKKRKVFLRRRSDMYVKSMRPQDRPELGPIDYRFP